MLTGHMISIIYGLIVALLYYCTYVSVPNMCSISLSSTQAHLTLNAVTKVFHRQGGHLFLTSLWPIVNLLLVFMKS